MENRRSQTLNVGSKNRVSIYAHVSSLEDFRRFLAGSAGDIIVFEL